MKANLNFLYFISSVLLLSCADGRRSGEEGQTTGQRNETITDDSDSSQRGSRKALGTGEGDSDSGFLNNETVDSLNTHTIK